MRYIFNPMQGSHEEVGTYFFINGMQYLLPSSKYICS